jgi:hypothetical protein
VYIRVGSFLQTSSFLGIFHALLIIQIYIGSFPTREADQPSESHTMPSTSGLNDDNIIFETGSKEVNRLQLQHEIIKDAMDSLIKPPLDLSKPGLQILDQATADGKNSQSCKTHITNQARFISGILILF